MKHWIRNTFVFCLAVGLTLTLAACQTAPQPDNPDTSSSPSTGDVAGDSTTTTAGGDTTTDTDAVTDGTTTDGTGAPTDPTTGADPSNPVTTTPGPAANPTTTTTKPAPTAKPTTTTTTVAPIPSSPFTLVKETLSQAGKVYITTSQEINGDDYVACTLQFVDPTGKYKTILDTDSEIKVRGHSTSLGEKKPYNIKFSGKTEVFGLGKAKKWCLLSNMYDKTLIRNKLAYDTAQVIGVPYTSSSAYVDVYLNGKLQGSYQICESVDVGSTQVDIDTDNHEYLMEYEPYPGYENEYYIKTGRFGITLGFNEPEEPTAAEKKWLEDFIKDAETALISRNEAQIRYYFDIDSMVNDYILHEIFKNVDALTSSARYHVKGGKIYGGPAWDFDLSSGNANREYYTSYYSSGVSYKGWQCKGIWYDDLLKCPWFEKEVIARFKELQPVIENLTDDNELGKNRIDYIQSIYGASFKSNFSPTGAGWDVKSIDSPYETLDKMSYDQHIETMRQWIRNRNAWMKQQWDID